MTDAPLHHDPDVGRDRRLVKELLRALLETAMADRARDAATPVRFHVRARRSADPGACSISGELDPYAAQLLTEEMSEALRHGRFALVLEVGRAPHRRDIEIRLRG